MPYSLHPAVQSWFKKTFDQPTPPQADAWPAIQVGKDTLIAAPTGSGKTLAAFLAALNDLYTRAARHELQAKTYVVYVSPLKALSNDIAKNLQEPLRGIQQEFDNIGQSLLVRAEVRTGDTPQKDRQRQSKNPPHILVTTPESLYLLLTSDSGRNSLSHVETLIIDEIHHILAGSIAKQKAFLTYVFGGPANYSGQDMRRGHAHLIERCLNDSHFDAVVELLGASLKELGVPDELIGKVASIAEGARADVLNR